MQPNKAGEAVLSKLPKTLDPFLGVTMNQCGIAPLTMAFLFFVLFGGIVASASFTKNIASLDQFKITLSQHSTILLGYPLFIFNVLAACTYYRSISKAVAGLFDSRFMHAKDSQTLEKATDAFFRKSHTHLRIKNSVIYVIVIWFVVRFHLLYLSDPGPSWLKDSGGKGLSLAGYLNMGFITLIVSIAVQFVWNHCYVSSFLFRIAELSREGSIRVSIRRYGFHPSLLPLIRLAWLACATVCPLFVYSALQVLVVSRNGSDVWQFVEIMIFFPAVYLFVAPIVFFGHFVPVTRILSDSRSELLESISNEDRNWLTWRPEFAPASTQDRAMSEQLEIDSKVASCVKDIPTSPINLKGVFVIALPFVLDIVIKIVSLWKG